MSVQFYQPDLSTCMTNTRFADLGTSIYIPALIQKACIDGVPGCERCVEYAPCTSLCLVPHS